MYDPALADIVLEHWEALMMARISGANHERQGSA
jgi:hypothetical protein